MPLTEDKGLSKDSHGSDALKDALHITQEFSKEIESMLRKHGIPTLNKPGEFPDISTTNITELPAQRLNQLQAEFVNAAAYVNDRLAIAKVELNYQKYLLKVRRANLEVANSNLKPADMKRIIAADTELLELESGKEYLSAISTRYTVYYDLYTANQAVLSREQSRRSAHLFNKGP